MPINPADKTDRKMCNDGGNLHRNKKSPLAAPWQPLGSAAQRRHAVGSCDQAGAETDPTRDCLDCDIERWVSVESTCQDCAAVPRHRSRHTGADNGGTLSEEATSPGRTAGQTELQDSHHRRCSSARKL